MSRRGVCAVVAAVAAIGPAAQAQDHVLRPGVLYGGGWVGAHRQLWLMAHSDEAQEHVDLAGRVEATCGAGTIAASGVAVPTSDFAASGETRDGATVTRWRLAGRFNVDGGAGKLDADLAVRRAGRTRRCSVRGRHWAVQWGSSDHRVGPPPGGGSRWSGELGKGGALNVLFAAAGDRAAIVTIAMDMTFCPGRRGPFLWAVMRDLPLDRDNNFGGTRKFTAREGRVRRQVELRVAATVFHDGIDAEVFAREIANDARTGRRLWACDSQGVLGYAQDVRLAGNG